MRHKIGFWIEDKEYWFDPKEDITTFELAKAMSFLLQVERRSRTHIKELFDEMGDKAKRHFVPGKKG